MQIPSYGKERLTFLEDGSTERNAWKITNGWTCDRRSWNSISVLIHAMICRRQAGPGE